MPFGYVAAARAPIVSRRLSAADFPSLRSPAAADLQKAPASLLAFLSVPTSICPPLLLRAGSASPHGAVNAWLRITNHFQNGPD